MRAAVANVAAPGRPPAGARDRGTAGLRSIEEQVLRLSRLTADLRKIAEVESLGDTTSGRSTSPELLKEAVDVAAGAAGRGRAGR